MYPERDFDPGQPVPGHAADATRDLALEALFDAMARGDDFLLAAVRSGVLSGTGDYGSVIYRQEVLSDFLRVPGMARKIYRLSTDTVELQKKHYLGVFSKSPSGIVYEAVRLLDLLVESLAALRSIADLYCHDVTSTGLRLLFTMLREELSDDYLQQVRSHLKNFAGDYGVLMRAQLGPGNRGVNYTLVRPTGGRSWLGRLVGRQGRGYSFHLSARDEGGHRVLAEMKGRGLNTSANALAQSAEHVLSFFQQLRLEVAFFAGCLNLFDTLHAIGVPVCLPTPLPVGRRHVHAQGLYDICLALNLKQPVVGNDLAVDDQDLWIVTGANQGGKSTFLRSIGIAQWMMQCGMFVAANNFTANLCEGVFTHFRREEDAAMRQGKFEEELGRLNQWVGQMRRGTLLLCNESFAATNEREGAEIARQIVTALVEHGVQVVFVTHLYTFADGVYRDGPHHALFLRAAREPDGTRTYRIEPGRPLATSFGRDLYREVFGTELS